MAVGVEKVHFPQNNQNLGDRKCPGKPRKSFVGHPDAILFLRISREGVFQQPRLLTTVEDLISRLPVIRPRRMMRAFHRIRRTIHFLVLDFARPKIDSTADTVPLGGVNMNKSLLIALACVALFPLNVSTQTTSGKTASFQAVPELPYRVVNNFLKFPKGMSNGESSGVAVNSKGHIFLFQRAKPMLAEYDEKGNFIQSIGEGLFAHPHGLRIDPDDNIWTTDDGNHLVLKLDSSGNVLLVLGRINTGAEANWLFNKPADVAFAKNGDIYVADGYGNSRIVKFDRDGNYIKAWIPAGGGCKEMLLRLGNAKAAFELIGYAKMSGSAAHARELGLLRAEDGISMNPERLVADAKAAALALAAGYVP